MAATSSSAPDRVRQYAEHALQQVDEGTLQMVIGDDGTVAALRDQNIMIDRLVREPHTTEVNARAYDIVSALMAPLAVEDGSGTTMPLDDVLALFAHLVYVRKLVPRTLIEEFDNLHNGVVHVFVGAMHAEMSAQFAAIDDIDTTKVDAVIEQLVALFSDRFIAANIGSAYDVGRAMNELRRTMTCLLSSYDANWIDAITWCFATVLMRHEPALLVMSRVIREPARIDAMRAWDDERLAAFQRACLAHIAGLSEARAQQLMGRIDMPMPAAASLYDTRVGVVTVLARV